MSLFTWTLAFSTIAAVAPAPEAQLRLAALVSAVRSADYRGDRPALARLDAELDALDAGPLTDYRLYWQGFARWRRAMNGMNETPAPADLAGDLEVALAYFQASLHRRPDWIEAKVGVAGCLGNLAYLQRDDPEKMQALMGDFAATYHWMDANGRGNPRALWILAGIEFFAPPPRGGDMARAAATTGRGLELSWQESAAGEAPAWVPTWGGPEHLMNLGFMYSHAAAPDRTAALAYAQGALTAVPEWHYVRDILIKQIEALPAAAAAN
ncbi:MAG: hypothetical protein ABI968_08140 [Acidobacteriota bacterium]